MVTVEGGPARSRKVDDSDLVWRPDDEGPVKVDDLEWRSVDEGPMKRDAACMYTTLRKYHCSALGGGNSEQLVRKCEKTMQVLRRCGDRPAEVVDSRTEYTEGDVPSEMLEGSRMNRSLQDQTWPSAYPDQSDVRPRFFLARLDDLLRAGEEAAQVFAERWAMLGDDKHAWPRRPSEKFPRSRFGEDGAPAGGKGAENEWVPNFDEFADEP